MMLATNVDMLIAGGIVILVVMLIVGAFKGPRTRHSPSQKNVEHIEWSPNGMPILKKRVRLDYLEIKPSQSEPGFLSFMGMSSVKVNTK